MKKLLFLFALLLGGLMASAQPLQRTVLKGTQYIQTDTLKSINGTSVSVDGNRITDVADPVNPQDAVTLKMLQDSLAGIITGDPDTDDQTLSIDSLGRVFTLSIEGGNSVSFEDQDTPTTGAEAAFDGWDKNAADDFSGDYPDLTNKPDLDAKADSIWVLGKNYLTAIPATYVQSGDNVSELVNDAGYLTVETDDQTASEVPVTIQNGIEQNNVQLELEAIREDLASGGDGWGSDVVSTDATLDGDGTTLDALGVADSAIDYAKVSATLKGTITDNDGAWDYSSTGTIIAAFSTNTTVSFSNLQTTKTLWLWLTITGSAVVTWPAYVKTVGDAIDADATYFITVACADSGSGTEKVVVFINKLP